MNAMITTDRLTLRQIWPTDADRITEIVSDPRVHRMVARIPESQTHAQTLAWIAGHATGRAEDTDHPYAILHNDTLIGTAGAHRSRTGEPFEIGYWLAPEAWGQGFTTEAADALIDWLKSRGEQAFVSGYFVDNPASGRVLDKLGFLKADRRKVFCLGRGESVDHYYMSRVG